MLDWTADSQMSYMAITCNRRYGAPCEHVTYYYPWNV